MKICAQLSKLVAVHAESDAITSHLAAKALAENKISIRDYLNSRPIHAELEAIHRAIEMSRDTKCALHIVHVSSGAGVALIASAQQQGVDVTCETCPHYLALTEDDLEQIGAVAKCAPPLRSKSAQNVLWRYLENGFVRTIGSDHSPSPPDMKRNYNFFKVWGGISGVQHTLSLMLTEGRVNRSIALSFLANLFSANVADRFKIPHKGKIAAGFDADFALVDLKQTFAVAKEDLFYRHQQTPYVGRALTGRVVQTILRGETIFKDGKIVGAKKGRLIKPIL
jgi:allantoinase